MSAMDYTDMKRSHCMEDSLALVLVLVLAMGKLWWVH